jgi:hypothetical protein
LPNVFLFFFGILGLFSFFSSSFHPCKRVFIHNWEFFL